MNKVGKLVGIMAAAPTCGAVSVKAADVHWSETGESFERACGKLPTHHALSGCKRAIQSIHLHREPI